ncbi:uncharacterized protein LOC111870941 isoform X2 [Cryptotermes secundus]|uniref:uncharacterized protein LOC111870941 isoform X2 n=1 Tax=Cryptotermes secundus TaxID=105785 RepID=UPI000CD7AF90|nr:uncharacterized protein LOC111870941 isoform X2 [Cryptotermes secundus]
MASTTSFAAVIIGLLTTYCYRVPSVLAIPDRKDIYVEDEWPLRRSYRVEDFLWSGSGDGQQDRSSGNGEDPGGGRSTWRTTTIVHTTTILTTVYPTPIYTTTLVQEYPPQTPSPCSAGKCTPEVSPPWSQESHSMPSGSIQPTPTIILPSTTVWPTFIPTGADRNVSIITPDQRFWLLTVLRVNASLPAPSTAMLETRLAQLYKVAFRRQQEHHFGINGVTAPAELKSRQARDHRAPDHVAVHVHNKTSKPADELALLYTVHVAGQPVLALAAAEDMKLVSSEEVTAELGYPVITKAEPYLKGPLPLDRGWRQGRARDTWLLVGAGLAAVSLLLLLIALFGLSLSKRKRNKRRVLAGHIQQKGGTANLGYEDEVDIEDQGKTGTSGFLPVPSSTAVTFRDDIIASQKRKGSSTSNSSEESSGTSLVRRRPGNGKKSTKIHEPSKRQGGSSTEQEVGTDLENSQPRMSTRSTKAMHPSHAPTLSKEHDVRHREPEDVDSNDELHPRNSPPVRPKAGTAISPNSFLSMPSIKAFPRGANIPEPLARVLEPVSVRHLDSEGGGIIVEPVRRLARHGSMEGEDPGVIGPLVWDVHCHRVHHQGILGESVDNLVAEATQDDMSRPDTSGSSVGRMRRRFHELLDDAFSLFGSRSESPGAEEDSCSPPTLHRVHSAIVRTMFDASRFRSTESLDA